MRKMLEFFAGWAVGTIFGALVLSFFVGARLNEERIAERHR